MLALVLDFQSNRASHYRSLRGRRFKDSAPSPFRHQHPRLRLVSILAGGDILLRNPQIDVLRYANFETIKIGH
jgi:hypothetical protein